MVILVSDNIKTNKRDFYLHKYVGREFLNLLVDAASFIENKKPRIGAARFFAARKYFLFLISICLKRNRILILIRQCRCSIAAAGIKILNGFCAFRSRTSGKE